MAKDPAQRFCQPGQLANAHHDVVAPGDAQRTAFPVRSPSLAPASQDGPALAATPLALRPRLTSASSSARVPMRWPSGSAGISRRSLLVAGGGAAVTIVAVAVFANRYLVGSTTPAGSTTITTAGGTRHSTSGSTSGVSSGHSGRVLAHTSDLPVNSAKTFPIGNSNNPGILVHLQNNKFVAFNSTCTHAGCAVDYNPQDHLLECPCHQAAFDPARGAAVVTGPAPSPLASIPITVNADNTITTQG